MALGSNMALLVGLYAVAVAVYASLGLLRHSPVIAPDEFTYGHLASSLAHGDGMNWGGAPVHMRAALYMYLITPSWWVASGPAAYTLAKLLGAAAICSVVFPVYLIARAVIPGRLALLPSGLVVLGAWMVSAGGVLTENLAFPLTALALFATVEALRRPGTKWVWLALAGALLAAWSRYQLVVLFPTIVCGLLIDVLRARGERKARLIAHRVPLLLTAGLAAAWAVLFLADPSLVGGSYVGIGSYRPSIGSVISDVWEHAFALVLMVGVLPAVAVTVVALRRSNWADESLGPLLATTVPFAFLLLLESAIFTAGYGLRWEIDRYAEYVVPLILVLFVAAVARREVRWPVLLSASAAFGTALFFSPSLVNAAEQRAIYGVSATTAGVLGTGVRLSIGLTAAALILVGLGVIRRHRRAAGLVLVALVGMTLISQSERAWEWQTRLSTHWAGQLPADKSWVDHHAGGPVARLIVSANSPLAETLSFFNRDITQVFVPAAPATYLGVTPLSHTCEWSAPGGYARFAAGCGPTPHRFLLDDPSAHMTFYGQRVIARDSRIGTLISVPGRVRLQSVLTLPCPRRYVYTKPSGGAISMVKNTQCSGKLQGSFWLDREALLSLTFRGGVGTNTVALGGRQWVIAPGRSTTVKVRIPAGGQALALQLDWDTSLGAPTVSAATLTSAGRRQSLL